MSEFCQKTKLPLLLLLLSSFLHFLTSLPKPSWSCQAAGLKYYSPREEMKRDEDFSFFCHSSTPYYCFFSKLPTRQKDQFAVAKPRPSSPHPQRQWRSLDYYLLSNNPITQNFSNALRFYHSTTSQIYYIILYYYYTTLLWCLLLYTMDDGWDKAKHTTPIYHRISYHLIHHQPPNKAEKRISFSTHPTHMFLRLYNSDPQL